MPCPFPTQQTVEPHLRVILFQVSYDTGLMGSRESVREEAED